MFLIFRLKSNKNFLVCARFPQEIYDLHFLQSPIKATNTQFLKEPFHLLLTLNRIDMVTLLRFAAIVRAKQTMIFSIKQ